MYVCIIIIITVILDFDYSIYYLLSYELVVVLLFLFSDFYSVHILASRVHHV